MNQRQAPSLLPMRAMGFNPLLPNTTGAWGAAQNTWAAADNPALSEPNAHWESQTSVQTGRVGAIEASAWATATANTIKAPSMMDKAVMRFNVPQIGDKERARLEKEQQVHAQAKKNAKKLQESWAKKQSAESPTEGYFQATLGQLVEGDDAEGKNQKYLVVNDRALGVGTFSTVFAAANGDGKLIALKVIRSQMYFRNYANQEVAIMVKIRDDAPKDEEGSNNIMMLLDHFMFGEHLCMVFDKLGTSLRSFGRQPLEKVISFSKQLLLALRYLHDTVGMMHCDVKPDNMLVRHDGMAVKLCDFGAAGHAPEKQHIDELQPLFYRAPEVIIGAPRGRKIDIWSAGCTIWELATGRILLRDCNSVRDCLEKIMRLRGVIPEAMRKQSRHEKTFFVEDKEELGSTCRFIPEAGGPQNLSNFKAKPMYQELAALVDYGKEKGLSAQDLAKVQLSRLIGGATVVAGAGKQAEKNTTDGEKKLIALADIIESCMNIDPSLRINAKDAVKATVFKDVQPPPPLALQDAPAVMEVAEPLPPEEVPASEQRLSSNVATVELVWENEY